MTQDEIIEMAVQAGMNREALPLMRNLELLTAFAKLVAQHEREECAERLDAVGCDHCAENIRRRGKE